jgi:hypothetical protein
MQPAFKALANISASRIMAQARPKTSVIQVELLPRDNQRFGSQTAPRLVNTAEMVFQRICKSRARDQFST